MQLCTGPASVTFKWNGQFGGSLYENSNKSLKLQLFYDIVLLQGAASFYRPGLGSVLSVKTYTVPYHLKVSDQELRW
jgi:hypothetical protein